MPKLLIIDDELDVVSYLKDFFSRYGVEVFTAATGEEGLALLNSARPHLILLDIKLESGIDGLEVVRRVREGVIPAEIIMVTAVDDRQVAEQVGDLGVADYITKPFVLKDLERIVLSRLNVQLH